MTLTLHDAPANAPVVLAIGPLDENPVFSIGGHTGARGRLVFDIVWPDLGDVPVTIQAWVSDPSAPSGWSASNQLSTSR